MLRCQVSRIRYTLVNKLIAIDRWINKNHCTMNASSRSEYKPVHLRDLVHGKESMFVDKLNRLDPVSLLLEVNKADEILLGHSCSRCKVPNPLRPPAA